MNRKKLCVNLSLFVGVSCSVAAMENPVYEMDGIVVTATRAEQAIEKIPNGIAVINKDQIEKSGARDLGELLTGVSGMSLQRKDNRKYFSIDTLRKTILNQDIPAKLVLLQAYL